jgi:chaperonin cofactor prefoldin
MTPERRRELQEKAARLRQRLEDHRKFRKESDKRLDAIQRELRELAGRG